MHDPRARHSYLGWDLGYHPLVADNCIRIGRDGSFSPTAEALRARFAKGAGDYRVDAGPEGNWLLTRLSPGGKPRGRVLMMGELVSRMTVVEIINLVTSANWRGELHIAGPTGSRILSVDQGALKHAQTDFESERLGQVLVRAGVLDAQILREVLNEPSHDRRLGQLLVERGLLDHGTLFKQLQNQAECIFEASLLEERGTYWFVTPPDDAAPPATTVHFPIQALLMEGVQRIDEMALYRERIPHNRLFPVAISSAPPMKTKDPLERQVLENVLQRCDGSKTIDDLARESSLGEFATVKSIHQLLRGSQVQLRRGPTLDNKVVTRLVRQFNDIVRDIFVVVATYSSMESASRALSSWLELGPHATVLGSRVDIDGTLDAKAVIDLLGSAALEDPMAQVHQSLHELAAYALFIASTGLPRHEEQSLGRDVNHRLKQLRL